MRIILIALIMLLASCQREELVPIYTCNADRWHYGSDSTWITPTCRDTIYGHRPSYGMHELSDTVTIHVWGRMIGTVKIKKKYLTKP